MLELKNVSKSYKVGTSCVNVLDNINIKLKEGEITAILGKNGSGKTTLLNVMGGLLSIDSGQIFYNEEQIYTSENNRRKFLEKNIGFILQNYGLIPEMTIYDNVALPLKYRFADRSKINEKVAEVLDFVRMYDQKNKYVYQLSGGERQRVAIARALIKNSKIILADEPTGALDFKMEKEFIEYLLKLKEEGKIIVVVTHSMDMANNFDVLKEISNGMLKC